MLADLRAMRFGHDHAHQIVRLRVDRRDPDRIAGLDFGLGQRALAEQEERQRLGRGQVVGIEEPYPPRLNNCRAVLTYSTGATTY